MREQGRHYERAIEAYLRSRRVPYVAVDEARRALMPARLPSDTEGDLKSFDIAIYPPGGPNLLVDVKGRRASVTGRMSSLQSWVTEEDVRSLEQWERLFDAGLAGAFRGAFAFVFWCDQQPPDGCFGEVFEHRRRWYALRTISLVNYARAMRPRSGRWRTVHLPAREFDRLSQPLLAPAAGASGSSGAAGEPTS